MDAFPRPKPSLIERDRWSWGRLVAKLIKSRGFRCDWCGGSERLEVDHILARAEGGSDHADNLRVLCHVCHRKRHNGLTPATIGAKSDVLTGDYGGRVVRLTGRPSRVVTRDYTRKAKP